MQKSWPNIQVESKAIRTTICTLAANQLLIIVHMIVALMTHRWCTRCAFISESHCDSHWLIGEQCSASCSGMRTALAPAVIYTDWRPDQHWAEPRSPLRRARLREMILIKDGRNVSGMPFLPTVLLLALSNSKVPIRFCSLLDSR